VVASNKEYRIIPGVKAAEAWHLLAAPSSGEVKQKVELYFCSPSVPSRHVVWWNLSLYNRTHNSYASSSLRNTNNTQTLVYVDDLPIMSWRFQRQNTFPYLPLLHTSATHKYTLIIIGNPSDNTLSLNLTFRSPCIVINSYNKTN